MRFLVLLLALSATAACAQRRHHIMIVYGDRLEAMKERHEMELAALRREVPDCPMERLRMRQEEELLALKAERDQALATADMQDQLEWSNAANRMGQMQTSDRLDRVEHQQRVDQWQRQNETSRVKMPPPR